MEQQQEKHSSSNIALKLALAFATCIILGAVLVMVYCSYKNNIKIQYIYKYKEANSVLLKALKASQKANGDLTSWDYSENQTQENFAKKYILPYIFVAKDCGTKKGAGCIAKNKEYKYLNEEPSGLILDDSDGYKFKNKDGISFLVKFIPSCISLDQYCFQIYTDINGPMQGPSQFGKDLFVFNAYPYTNEFKPYGTYSNDKKSFDPYTSHWKKYPEVSDCTEGGLGLTCGTRLILDGYEMNY